MEREPRQAGLAGVDRWVGARPVLVDSVLAVTLAALLGVASAQLVWAAPWPVAGRVGVLAAIGLAHAAVAARRAAPVPAYGVTCAAMLVLVAAPEVPDGSAGVPPILVPSALMFPVLLYAVAAYAPRPWPVAALGVALAGAVLTLARLWTFEWPESGPDSGWTLFLVGALPACVLAPWALGRFRAVRAAYRAERLAALEERAAVAEERRAERAAQAAADERARIAREMHDVVAHSLAVIVRQADGGRFAAAKDPARAVEALGAIATTGRQALTDMRSVLGVLRHDGPAGEGAAPQPGVDDVPALVDRVRAAGTPVSLVTSGPAGSLDRAASLAAYRVVQEALTNVVRHAGTGAAAAVRLDWRDGGLDVAVTDDGTAARPPAPGTAQAPGTTESSGSPESPESRGSPGIVASPASGGRGLIGMRERVAAVGGRLTAGPDGHGFAVRAHLPSGGGPAA